MANPLLHYRAWQGSFHSPIWSIWPIARVALGMLFRRKLFWSLYAFGLLLFLMFFFGFYLFAWAESQAATTNVQVGRFAPDPQQMVRMFRNALRVLNGSQETFQYFFAYQGAMVVVTLALVGALLVGNDFTFRSLPFYLSKPISRWHYILGKCLAVGTVVMMMTALPALGLYAQHAFDDWNFVLDPDYFVLNDTGKGPASWQLLLGILGYGLILSVVLSLLLVATASWMRRTMPLIMVWMSLFFFMRLLANVLVDGLKYDVRWRLLDLWNNMGLLGQWCLDIAHNDLSNQPQPEFLDSSLVLLGVCAVCLIYLNLRTRGVEIVK